MDISGRFFRMASGDIKMVAYEPHGIEVRYILQMWRWSKGLFMPSSELRPSSCPIDYFISHSWAACSFSKFLAIFLLFAGKLPFIASAMVAIFITVIDVHVCFRLLFTLSAFIFGLILEHRHPRSTQTVFFDIACIPQTQCFIDQALASLERCIKSSRGLIVLWTDDCRRSKWCIFELATFLHHNPDKPLEIWCLPSLEQSLILCTISTIYFLIRFSMADGGHLLLDIIYSIIVTYFIVKVDLPNRLRFLRDSRNIKWFPQSRNDSEYPLQLDEVINEYFGSWQGFSAAIERRKVNLSDQWGSGISSALKGGLLMAFPAVLVGIITHYAVAASLTFLLPPVSRAVLFYAVYYSRHTKRAKAFYDCVGVGLALLQVLILQTVWHSDLTNVFCHSLQWSSVVFILNILFYSTTPFKAEVWETN